MKTKYLYYTFTFLLLFVFVCPSLAQSTNKPRKQANRSLSTILTKNKQKEKTNQASNDIFQQATSLAYHASNGPLPEHYSFEITFSKQRVNLKIYEDYTNKPSYDKSASISTLQFQQLAKALSEMGFKKIDAEPLVGGPSSYLEVSKGSTILFKGEENVDFRVGKGNIREIFIKHLPAGMAKELRKVINHYENIP